MFLSLSLFLGILFLDHSSFARTTQFGETHPLQVEVFASFTSTLDHQGTAFSLDVYTARQKYRLGAIGAPAINYGRIEVFEVFEAFEADAGSAKVPLLHAAHADVALA